MLYTALLASAGLTAVIYGLWAISRYIWIPFVVCGLFVVFATELTPILPNVYVGGVRISLFDYFSAILITITVDRILRNKSSKNLSTAVRTLALCLTATFAYSLVRGAVSYGVGSAINESRQVIYAIAMIAWVTTIDLRSEALLDMVRKWSVGLILGTSLIATFHIAENGLGSTTENLVTSAGDEIGGRPLTAGQAMTLALAALVIFAKSQSNRTKMDIPILVVAAIVIVLAQQRTVWLALLVGLVILTLQSNLRQQFRSVGLLVYGVVAAALVLVAAPLDAVVELIGTSGTDTKTLDGREEGWIALFVQWTQSDPHTILFGYPFGHGWLRFQSGTYVSWSPHNWYLNTLLRSGLIGVLCFAALIVAVAAGSYRLKLTPPASAIGGAALIYWWTYGLDWYWMPFLGLVLIVSSKNGAKFVGDPSELSERGGELSCGTSSDTREIATVTQHVRDGKGAAPHVG